MTEKMAVIVPVSFKEISDWENSIKNYIIEKYVGNCTLEKGYITEITKISINDNVISRIEPVILVNVEVEYETFNPQKGDVLECKVTMMFSEGIWTEKQAGESTNVCIAIPKNNISREWNKTTNTFQGISIDDVIKVKVTNIHFDGTMKKYIGSLVD